MVLARRLGGPKGPPGGPKGPGGSPTVYGGVGSPHKLAKTGKSPFKRRVSGLSVSNSKPAPGGGGSSGVAANIRVAVRVRPENSAEEAGAFRNVIEVVDDRMLIFDPKNDEDDFFFHGKKQNRQRDLNKAVRKDHTFTFDVVFGPTSNNEDVFVSTTKDLVDVLFDGYNCSVFVYGATGAGKTHTMLGSAENPGITFKTVMELYKRIEEKMEECSCEIAVSYLEVYNETIVDLINQSSGPLAIRDDGSNAINIPGLSIHKPSGPDDLLSLLQHGNANRQQHPTDANSESSRSHAVFQVMLKQTGRNEGLKGSVKVAKLSMIDLAGSEKGSVTSSRAKARFREGANINKSLLALGNCINALAEGSKYIPYRNSKLTRLLKDSIGGNCRTVMISNVSPSSMSFEDTYNTLKYADRAKKIKINLKKNLVSVNFHVGQYAKIVEELKSEVSGLKRKNSALVEENAVLTQQLENSKKSRTDHHDSSEELYKLREEVAALRERQSAFEELESRVKRYEAKSVEPATSQQRLGNIESSEGGEELVEEVSDEVAQSIEDATNALKKWADEVSKVKILELKRLNYRAMVDRRAIFTSEASTSKAMRRMENFLENADRKIQRGLRSVQKAVKMKTSSLEIALDAIETTNMKNKAWEKKKFEFHCQLTEKNFEDDHNFLVIKQQNLAQSRTNDILVDSLKQLEKSHLLLRSTGNANQETINQYQSLLQQIECSAVQFRDTLLSETNLEEISDQIASSPVRDILDLRSSSNHVLVDTTGDANVTCTVGEDDVFQSAETIVSFPSHILRPEVAGNETVEEVEEDTGTAVWRPPTPPKVSPQSQGEASLPKHLAEKYSSSTFGLTSTSSSTGNIHDPVARVLDLTKPRSPHLPQATSLDSTFDVSSAKAPSPSIDDMDATFDVNSQQRLPGSVTPTLGNSSQFRVPVTTSVANLPGNAGPSMDMTFDVSQGTTVAESLSKPEIDYLKAPMAQPSSHTMDSTFNVHPDIIGNSAGQQQPLNASFETEEAAVNVPFVSPVVAADTTVVLEDPVFNVKGGSETRLTTDSEESAVTSSSDGGGLSSVPSRGGVTGASSSLSSLKTNHQRKPNYMTATTASTHRFKPSSLTQATLQSANKPYSAKKFGRSPSPNEASVRATARPTYNNAAATAASHKTLLVPGRQVRKAKTPSPKRAGFSTENSNPLGMPRNNTQQQQLAKSLAAKTKMGSETSVKRPYLGRSVSTSALKHLNK